MGGNGETSAHARLVHHPGRRRRRGGECWGGGSRQRPFRSTGRLRKAVPLVRAPWVVTGWKEPIELSFSSFGREEKGANRLEGITGCFPDFHGAKMQKAQHTITDSKTSLIQGKEGGTERICVGFQQDQTLAVASRNQSLVMDEHINLP